MKIVKKKVVFYIFFILILSIVTIFMKIPRTESKEKIKFNEINTKLKINNQNILIPSKQNVLNAYIIDDGFTSPHAEINLSNLFVAIYTSSSFDDLDSKEVFCKQINNSLLKEYQTKNNKVEYVFKADNLIYVYIFSESNRKDIDEYLTKNLK